MTSPADVELHIPYANSEQEFLRRAVEAAAKTYRQLQRSLQEEHADHNELTAPK